MKTNSCRLLLLMVLVLGSNGVFAQSSTVLKYLYSISGTKTLAGQHNREPNAEPVKWTEYIHQTTG